MKWLSRRRQDVRVSTMTVTVAVSGLPGELADSMVDQLAVLITQNLRWSAPFEIKVAGAVAPPLPTDEPLRDPIGGELIEPAAELVVPLEAAAS